MSETKVYLTLGFRHIANLRAYDHMLFLVALCAVYQISQWRRITILVTAFTIGHSLTLALATLGVVILPSKVIEFLIPLTIFVTCVLNVRSTPQGVLESKFQGNYLLALFFGLIHGLGFSNYLRALLGGEESILVPLFSFNVGLELGQLMIVAVILIISFSITNGFHLIHRRWNLAVSILAAGVSLMLMYQTKFW